MKDDLDDYGGFDGGYVQDYEDFMWPPLRNPSYCLSDETHTSTAHDLSLQPDPRPESSSKT